MISVPFDEPQAEEWHQWRKSARALQKSIREKLTFKTKPEIDPNVYKEMRKYLMERFNNKCAYCETPILRHTPDVEHYRPKARVTTADRKVVRIIDQSGTERDHPGYYWLAYEWSNLLPSCEFCNRKRYHEGQDESWGKETCFPVRNDLYRWSPKGRVKEEPLLIHPRFHDPKQHLRFVYSIDPKKTPSRICFLQHLDDRGDVTIRVLGLNDERLSRPRLQAYDLGYGKMGDIFEAIKSLGNLPTEEKRRARARINDLKREVNRIWEGVEPYSAFGRLGIEDYRENHRFILGQDIPMPLPILPDA
jgi:hypothetical protein